MVSDKVIYLNFLSQKSHILRVFRYLSPLPSRDKSANPVHFREISPKIPEDPENSQKFLIKSQTPYGLPRSNLHLGNGNVILRINVIDPSDE